MALLPPRLHYFYHSTENIFYQCPFNKINMRFSSLCANCQIIIFNTAREDYVFHDNQIQSFIIVSNPVCYYTISKVLYLSVFQLKSNNNCYLHLGLFCFSWLGLTVICSFWQKFKVGNYLEPRNSKSSRCTY